MKYRILVSLVSVIVVGTLGSGVAGASSRTTEYFTAVATSATGNAATVVAAGPISATGTDNQTSARRDTFVFPNGSLMVRHEPVTQKQTFDGRTCVSTFVETGTYVVAWGTGAYAHVTGSGNYKSVAVIQGCDESAPPTTFAQTISAHGPLSL